ncbi:carbohydrate ABC transporter membrane protein 2 (CUT1 family) [Paenibacillus taihuensis]|uniref:Carbohydrate ABC transporter membrane protein 2 (CUT1 family) n=1 Tax=Paenibacillus taihuensis TaxID=1156355 RepID=A0A3D9QTM8_9BACL|nr:carbohydrate ABC transporter permease [Paenibacillus taihuensis]REE66645.1 carbohydrate ABC transporter membrane protein 2 (CUT1 family) [Paenibacillus taihuensis]
MKGRTMAAIRKGLTHLILLAVSVMLVFPFVWMVSGAFKDSLEVVKMPPQLLPSHFRFENFVQIGEFFPLYRFLLNSVGIAVVTTALQLIVCAMAAYVFAKIAFRGRQGVFMLFLATMMIPAQVTLVPLFILFSHMHLLNTYAGLILPGIFSAYGTFLLRQNMMTIPNELLEAAFMDGATYYRVFWSVMLPLVKPVLAALSIFAFMSSWNSFLWPLISTNSKELMTLPLGLSMLQGKWSTDWNLLMAGNVISFVPIFTVYLFAQRYFIKGMTMTGIK